MDEIEKEQQETYLQTIRARLERAEDGRIQWLRDNEGPWNIINSESRTKSGSYTFFQPVTGIGYDEYGYPLTPSV